MVVAWGTLIGWTRFLKLSGTVVTDDGALALHHGEGEGEVRWGQD
jgi:hypothetical protein